MKTIHIASVALFNSKNELLLVRKKESTYFQLTGGKLEPQELPTQTVVRETWEEIGFQINTEDLVFLKEHTTKAVNETNTFVHGTIYTLHTGKEFDPQIASEIASAAWLNASNYKTYKWAHLAEEVVLPYCLTLWNKR